MTTTLDPGWQHHTMIVDGRRVFIRSTVERTDEVPMVHVHGFGISGSYLMPTARLLADTARQVVPDLPGYGRSQRPPKPLTIPQLADALVLILDAMRIERAILIGNSMGCPIIAEVCHHYPDRVAGVVLVAPAGGIQNRPLRRAVGQLAVDGVRESPRMARVAVPDYVKFGPINALKLFAALTRYPSLERLLEMNVRALAVLGSKDPLMPTRERVLEVAAEMPDNVTVVVITGAAHAVNFSHPGELAHVIRSWAAGEEIVDDPEQPGLASVLEIPRG
jgi:pimeloyl-ACP methyl ester carboxylesterase